MVAAIVLSAILTVFALFFTLAWWRIADHWADNEHKRFKNKPRVKSTGPRVISKTPPAESAHLYATPNEAEGKS